MLNLATIAVPSDITTPPRRHSLGRMMSSSTVLLLFVIGALIVILALLILFHHNMNATKGYKLRSLEFARTQLLLEQEVLNMEIAKSQSLDTMENDVQIKAMEKPKKVRYARVDAALPGQLSLRSASE
jgi:hypothetical protein